MSKINDTFNNKKMSQEPQHYIMNIYNIDKDDYNVIKNSIKIPTVKPLYSNDINNILKDLFEQAYNKIDKNTKTVRETILMMRQIADNKGEKLPDNWEEITRDKIKNEWAKNKPD